MSKTCSIEGCPAPHEARGLCNLHYKRLRKYGDPLPRIPRRAHDPEAWFGRHIREEGECLVWTGYRNAKGYGQMKVYGRLLGAYRYAWERERGPVPAGMVLDHTCWNPSCVNVNHLRLATHSQNNAHLSGPQKNNILGVRNVSQTKYGFTVRVKRNGVVYRSGPYSTIDEAAMAADQLRERVHHQFAGRPNVSRRTETP